jgi:hypothetical protein
MIEYAFLRTPLSLLAETFYRTQQMIRQDRHSSDLLFNITRIDKPDELEASCILQL